MAWKFDKALYMKANADAATSTRFQRLIENLLSRNLQAVINEFDRLTNEEKVLIGLRVGKDGNTLTHRLCSGVVSENAARYLDAMLPDDPAAILGAPNKMGVFPIHAVTQNGFDTLISYLVNHGVDINQRDLVKGDTAAVLAAKSNDFDLLTTLIEHGADITIKNKEGKTCQDYILENNDQETALKWSALMIVKNASDSGLLVEKNDGKKRSARSL